MTNHLSYGDNLALRRAKIRFPDAFVDPIYLDPPFNSNTDYLFKTPEGETSAAQQALGWAPTHHSPAGKERSPVWFHSLRATLDLLKNP